MTSKILVVGDIIIDKYLYGECIRISPEAPVPIIVYRRTDYRPGGSANVAANVNTLGGEAFLFGVLDPSYSHHILTNKLLLDGYTNLKVRVMANGQQVCRVDYDRGDASRLSHALDVMKVVPQLFDEHAFDGVIISDYDKGFITRQVASYLVQSARMHDIPCFVDTKKMDVRWFEGATIITPNEDEDSEIVWDGYSGSRLITRGSAGMTMWFDDDHFIEIEAEQVDVADVTGAGDTVLAALAVRTLEGASMEEAARFANSAAAKAVTKHGTSVVHRSEL